MDFNSAWIRPWSLAYWCDNSNYDVIQERFLLTCCNYPSDYILQMFPSSLILNVQYIKKHLDYDVISKQWKSTLSDTVRKSSVYKVWTEPFSSKILLLYSLKLKTCLLLENFFLFINIMLRETIACGSRTFDAATKFHEVFTLTHFNKWGGSLFLNRVQELLSVSKFNKSTRINRVFIKIGFSKLIIYAPIQYSVKRKN